MPSLSSSASSGTQQSFAEGAYLGHQAEGQMNTLSAVNPELVQRLRSIVNDKSKTRLVTSKTLPPQYRNNVSLVMAGAFVGDDGLLYIITDNVDNIDETEKHEKAHKLLEPFVAEDNKAVKSLSQSETYSTVRNNIDSEIHASILTKEVYGFPASIKHSINYQLQLHESEGVPRDTLVKIMDDVFSESYVPAKWKDEWEKAKADYVLRPMLPKKQVMIAKHRRANPIYLPGGVIAPGYTPPAPPVPPAPPPIYLPGGFVAPGYVAPTPPPVSPPAPITAQPLPVSVVKGIIGGGMTPPESKPVTTEPIKVATTPIPEAVVKGIIGGGMTPPESKPVTTEPIKVATTPIPEAVVKGIIGGGMTPPESKPVTTEPIKVATTPIPEAVVKPDVVVTQPIVEIPITKTPIETVTRTTDPNKFIVRVDENGTIVQKFMTKDEIVDLGGEIPIGNFWTSKPEKAVTIVGMEKPDYGYTEKGIGMTREEYLEKYSKGTNDVSIANKIYRAELEAIEAERLLNQPVYEYKDNPKLIVFERNAQGEIITYIDPNTKKIFYTPENYKWNLGWKSADYIPDRGTFKDPEYGENIWGGNENFKYIVENKGEGLGHYYIKKSDIGVPANIFGVNYMLNKGQYDKLNSFKDLNEQLTYGINIGIYDKDATIISRDGQDFIISGVEAKAMDAATQARQAWETSLKTNTPELYKEYKTLLAKTHDYNQAINTIITKTQAENKQKIGNVITNIAQGNKIVVGNINNLTKDEIVSLILANKDPNVNIPQLLVASGQNIDTVNSAVNEVNIKYEAYKNAQSKLSGAGFIGREGTYDVVKPMTVQALAEWQRNNPNDTTTISTYFGKELVNNIKEYNKERDSISNDISSLFKSTAPELSKRLSLQNAIDSAGLLTKYMTDADWKLLDRQMQAGNITPSLSKSSLKKIWNKISDNEKDSILENYNADYYKSNYFAEATKTLMKQQEELVKAGGVVGQLISGLTYAPITGVTGVVAKQLTINEAKQYLNDYYKPLLTAVSTYRKSDGTVDVNKLDKDIASNTALKDKLLNETGYANITDLKNDIDGYNNGVKVTGLEWAEAGATLALDVVMAGTGGGMGIGGLGTAGRIASGGVFLGSAGIFAPSTIKTVISPEVSGAEKALAIGGELMLITGGVLSMKAPRVGVIPAIEKAVDKVASEVISPNRSYNVGYNSGKFINIATGKGVVDALLNIADGLDNTSAKIKLFVTDTMPRGSINLIMNGAKIIDDISKNVKYFVTKGFPDKAVSLLMDSAKKIDDTIAQLKMNFKNIPKETVDTIINSAEKMDDIVTKIKDAYPEITNKVIDTILKTSSNIDDAVAKIKSEYPKASESIDNIINTANTIDKVIAKLKDSIPELREKSVEATLKAAHMLDEKMADIKLYITKTFPDIKIDEILSKAETLDRFTIQVRDYFKKLPDVTIDRIMIGAKALDDVSTEIKTYFKNIPKVKINEAVDNIMQSAETIDEITSKLKNFITKELPSNTVDALMKLAYEIDNAVSKIKTFKENFPDKFVDYVMNATANLDDMAKSIKEYAKSIPDKITDISMRIAQDFDKGFEDARVGATRNPKNPTGYMELIRQTTPEPPKLWRMVKGFPNELPTNLWKIVKGKEVDNPVNLWKFTDYEVTPRTDETWAIIKGESTDKPTELFSLQKGLETDRPDDLWRIDKKLPDGKTTQYWEFPDLSVEVQPKYMKIPSATTVKSTDYVKIPDLSVEVKPEYMKIPEGVKVKSPEYWDLTSSDAKKAPEYMIITKSPIEANGLTVEANNFLKEVRAGNKPTEVGVNLQRILNENGIGNSLVSRYKYQPDILIKMLESKDNLTDWMFDLGKAVNKRDINEYNATIGKVQSVFNDLPEQAKAVVTKDILQLKEAGSEYIKVQSNLDFYNERISKLRKELQDNQSLLDKLDYEKQLAVKEPKTIKPLTELEKTNLMSEISQDNIQLSELNGRPEYGDTIARLQNRITEIYKRLLESEPEAVNKIDIATLESYVRNEIKRINREITDLYMKRGIEKTKDTELTNADIEADENYLDVAKRTRDRLKDKGKPEKIVDVDKETGKKTTLDDWIKKLEDDIQKKKLALKERVETGVKFEEEWERLLREAEERKTGELALEKIKETEKAVEKYTETEKITAKVEEKLPEIKGKPVVEEKPKTIIPERVETPTERPFKISPFEPATEIGIISYPFDPALYPDRAREYERLVRETRVVRGFVEDVKYSDELEKRIDELSRSMTRWQAIRIALDEAEKSIMREREQKQLQQQIQVQEKEKEEFDKPFPVIMPSPTSKPEAKPEIKPQPQPVPMPESKIEIKTELQPKTESMIKPIPPIPTPPPQPLSVSGESGSKKVELPYAALTWKQGNHWGYITPNELMSGYNEKDVKWLKEGEIPAGIYKYATGKGSAYKTLQILPMGAKLPSDADIDMGWAKIHITSKEGTLTMNFAGGKKAAEDRWAEEERLVEEEKIVREQMLSQAQVESKNSDFQSGMTAEEKKSYEGTPQGEVTERIPKISETQYGKLYEDIVARAKEMGFKVIDVPYEQLHDYAAMHPIMAKKIGYDMPDNEIHMNARWNNNIEERTKNLRHELDEYSDMEKGDEYWAAHVEATKRESTDSILQEIEELQSKTSKKVYNEEERRVPTMRSRKVNRQKEGSGEGLLPQRSYLGYKLRPAPINLNL